MNKTGIWVLIGFLISGVIMYPKWKKEREEQKAREEELTNRTNEMIKNAMDDELNRHKKVMDEIVEKGEREREEMVEKTKQDLMRIAKIGKKYNPEATMVIKYEDENGIVHEVDAYDYKAFEKIMSNPHNKLIFS